MESFFSLFDINSHLLSSFDHVSCSWFTPPHSRAWASADSVCPWCGMCSKITGVTPWYLIQYSRLSILFTRDTRSIPGYTSRSPSHFSSFLRPSHLSFSSTITGLLLYHCGVPSSRVLLFSIPQFLYAWEDIDSRHGTHLHVIRVLFLPSSRCFGLLMWHIGVNFISYLESSMSVTVPMCGLVCTNELSVITSDKTQILLKGPNQLSFIDVSLIPRIMGSDGMPKGPCKSPHVLLCLFATSVQPPKYIYHNFNFRFCRWLALR